MVKLEMISGLKYRRLLERWWRSRIVRYVDKFHKKIIALSEKPLDGKQGPGGDWQGNLQARQIMARDLERYVWRVETQRKAKVGVENPKLDNSRKLRGITSLIQMSDSRFPEISSLGNQWDV